MSSYETHHVCKDCFTSTRFQSRPKLEVYRDREGKCLACGKAWNGVTVGYYPPDNNWYEVRPRPFNSEKVLCQNKLKGKCYRDTRCRRAHNKLELHVWSSEGRERKGANYIKKPKFRCIICYDEFPNSENLNAHMQSEKHHARADALYILPEVGSCLEYTGPIRQRPKLPYHKQDYELCRSYARSNRCQYGTGCKHAHSEELGVWKRALVSEEYYYSQRRRFNYQEEADSSSKSDYRSNSPSSSKGAESGSERAHKRNEKRVDEDPEYLEHVIRAIRKNGIKTIIGNRPKHIELSCDKNLTVTVSEDNKSTQITWSFKLKARQPDRLIAIVLHEHDNVFRLGDIFKCSVKGTGKSQPRYECTSKKTSYLVDQEVSSEWFIEVALIGKPRIGRYTVCVVFQLDQEVFFGREVTLKIRGEEFRQVTDNFRTKNKPQPKCVPTIEDLLKVNWESSFELVDCKPDSLRHPMPDYIEEKLAKSGYDHINDEILPKNYVLRFNSLLFIEEFEHKNSLLKYDLQNEAITFKTVTKQITIEKEFGRDVLKTAPLDARYITFRLKHQLFEGYRSFRPPKLAYVIPNKTRKAYTCSSVHFGMDYIVMAIGIDAIKACERSDGLAMVRFSPDRDEYVNMHEAVETTNTAILFPKLRNYRQPRHWDEDHLLYMLDYEQLSEAQKLAILSIMDSYYQTLPTIICGPFGCGKTKTLSVAAKLIAQTYYRSRILIATKTNSCANLYIELLGEDFDSISMYREQRSRRDILFRHFGKSRNISFDKHVNEFANIQGDVYYGLPVYELECCAIVVTTIRSAATLLPPRARGHRQDLFTHIFIDEAAQIIEPEACIPLSLAGDHTKIALAGDIHQSRPVILSGVGLKYGLDKSLLERFELIPDFQTEEFSQCKVSLYENFRSRASIVLFLSELFYDNKLTANPPFLTGPLDFPALSFLHVSGEEQRLHGFPSYFNEEEANLTIKALRKFVSSGVSVGNIAVLTTFHAQEALIRDYLRQEGSNCRMQGHFRESQSQFCRNSNCINSRTIEVKNLEGIQGREYDLVIINTVRTLKEVNEEDISLEEKLDLGMLHDVTQFNTILTRARGWVMVIGKADCLTSVGGCSQVWNKYIERCKSLGGYFETAEEMNEFSAQTRRDHLKKGTSSVPKEKLATNQNSSDPQASANPVKSNDPLDLYDTKFKSLQTFITSCYKELMSIKATDPAFSKIDEQLQFAKMTLELLQGQKYSKQQSHRVDGPTEHSTHGYVQTQGRVLPSLPIPPNQTFPHQQLFLTPTQPSGYGGFQDPAVYTGYHP